MAGPDVRADQHRVTAFCQVASCLLALRKQNPDAGAGGCVGDLLLFGNRQRMPIDDDLEEIFLHSLVKLLNECFSPKTGWKQCLISLKPFQG